MKAMAIGGLLLAEASIVVGLVEHHDASVLSQYVAQQQRFIHQGAGDLSQSDPAEKPIRSLREHASLDAVNGGYAIYLAGDFFIVSVPR